MVSQFKSILNRIFVFFKQKIFLMESNYNKYGRAAVKVALYKGDSIKAWEKATKKLSFSDSSQKKPCPMNAFLGLCEEDLVTGIKAGSYFTSTKPNVNKKYAISAIKILKTNSALSPKELWNRVREELSLGEKRHNSQMDVVLALWENNLLTQK